MAQIAAHQNNQNSAPARDNDRFGNLSDYGLIEPLTAEPELRLMANILQDAMECYLRFANAASPNARREFRDAEKWLFGGSHDWIFSFESICDHLGTEPSFVRCLLRSR